MEIKDKKNELSGESSNDSISSMSVVVKQTADIDGFITKRQEFIQKVSAICVEGKDYHIIKDKKKSLAKGGAEKIASIFQWNAIFEKDTESLEMLGAQPGLVAFKCTIRKGTKFVGEGRGAATTKGNSGDANKTLKMAQKSAFIDAILRASGLSDFFTQDLEDLDQRNITTHQNTTVTFYPASASQIELIKKLKTQKGYDSNEIVKALKLNLNDKFSKSDASRVINWLSSAVSKVKVTDGPLQDDWQNVGDPDER